MKYDYASILKQYKDAGLALRLKFLEKRKSPKNARFMLSELKKLEQQKKTQADIAKIKIVFDSKPEKDAERWTFDFDFEITSYQQLIGFKDRVWAAFGDAHYELLEVDDIERKELIDFVTLLDEVHRMIWRELDYYKENHKWINGKYPQYKPKRLGNSEEKIYRKADYMQWTIAQIRYHSDNSLRGKKRRAKREYQQRLKTLGKDSPMTIAAKKRYDELEISHQELGEVLKLKKG